MTISLSSLGVQSTLSTSSVPSTASVNSAQQSSTVGDATSVDLSKPGEFLAALQKLKDENPDQFSSVVSSLAQEVRDQAKAASGREQKFLTQFADRLDKVASSQDLSALQPPQGGSHARGAKAYPPPPPDGSNDGDADDGGTAKGASVSSSQPTLPGRAAMEALLGNLIKQVEAATSSTASNDLTSSTSTAVAASNT